MDEATSRLKHWSKILLARYEKAFMEKPGVNDRWDNADCKERRKMVTVELRKEEEEKKILEQCE